MNTTKSLRAKLVSITATLGLGALLALGAAAPSHAATSPSGDITFTGVATCGTNGNYSVKWTAESTPLRDFGVSIPTAWTPEGSVVPRGIWIHNTRVHAFTQNAIPGDATTATVTTTLTIYTAARTATFPIVGSIDLDGTCRPAIAPSHIHQAFKHLRHR
jgi:hypothetical protein